MSCKLGELPVSGSLFYDSQANTWKQFEMNAKTGEYSAVTLSQNMASRIATASFELAKDTFCKIKETPESISVSVGFASATWSKEQLCGSEKK